MAKKKTSNLKRAQEEAAAVEAAPKKKKAKRKTKKKVAVEARMKLYWGVFSQSLKMVAVYEFDQKSEADARATELSKNGKSPHFSGQIRKQQPS